MSPEARGETDARRIILPKKKKESNKKDILLRVFAERPLAPSRRSARGRNPLLPTRAVTIAIRLRKSERMAAAATLDTLVRRQLFRRNERNVSHYRDGLA